MLDHGALDKLGIRKRGYRMIGMMEAVRGCLKEEVRADVIANNLANATMIGFKRDKISFRNMLMGKPPGGNASLQKTSGPDTGLARVVTDFSGGPIRHTGNTLDLAIKGKGFFKIQTPQGVRYTRKGNFATDAKGLLVTQDGNPVLGRGGPIILSGKDVVFDQSGRVLVDGTEVGQLDLVDVSKPEELEKVGGALFQAVQGNDEVPLPEGTVIRQGYVEDSNVDVAMEMVSMIRSLRAFESYQKAIQVMDSLNKETINDVSRLR